MPKVKSFNSKKKRVSIRHDIHPFLQNILKLKRINREGWISKAKINEPESVADHSFSVCAISMALSDILGLDTERVLKMAILHDLPESITGDLVPSEVTMKQKRARESRAISTILSTIDSQTRLEYEQLWKEYVSDRTEISRLVHAVDKLDMALQAKQYAIEGHPAHLLAEFSKIPEKYMQTFDHKIFSQIDKALRPDLLGE
jgi:putative hydrolase of HD superfamily